MVRVNQLNAGYFYKLFQPIIFYSTITDCKDMMFKYTLPSKSKCTITLYESTKTVQFQGTDEKKIKELIFSMLPVSAAHKAGCCPIYENERRHIKQRVDKEPILGYPYQFCAAFFHTHRRGEGNRVREHQCLDEKRCIISKRALDEGFRVQPETVVAVVKFENDKKEVVYEAKYTNCVSAQQHAGDFFKEDVEKGELKTKIDEKSKGTITMYLTLQPCNEFTSISGTEGTPPKKSCCNTLVNVKKTLPGEISLHIKVTHTNQLSTSKAQESEETLRQNAVIGIKKLMNSGVEVSAMDREDWGYLFSMTIKESRDELDHEIKDILGQIKEAKDNK